ncbi:ABC transporter ATP-binding protein [Alsobacter soli]|uniref:ABC transporter ATP-binding protein n=1 Tax=Alsobacter soli TaxID=2109933 RepID=UPI003CC980A9
MAARKPAAEVRLEGVGKRYGKVTAVKPLDLVIEAGSLVTLLGPSGCGKTTLLRMIAGLEQPTDGRLLIGGRDVTHLPPGERDVSMVFQSYALFPHMTIAQNVAFGLISGGMAKDAALAKADLALDQVGLPGLGGRLPSELSGGQQQRVAVARALVLEPSVLLFDEPLSNLDARLRRRMREEIRDLQQRLGVTVVYVTHDQSEALAVADKIVVMRNSEIAQIGSPRELYQQPANTFVASFMGECNNVKADLADVAGGRGRLTLGSSQVLTAVPDGLEQGQVDVAIRPEAVRVLPKDSGCLQGVVSHATYMGSCIEYEIETDIGGLFVVCGDIAGMRAKGDPVGLDFVASGIAVVRP